MNNGEQNIVKKFDAKDWQTDLLWIGFASENDPVSASLFAKHFAFAFNGIHCPVFAVGAGGSSGPVWKFQNRERRKPSAQFLF